MYRSFQNLTLGWVGMEWVGQFPYIEIHWFLTKLQTKISWRFFMADGVKTKQVLGMNTAWQDGNRSCAKSVTRKVNVGETNHVTVVEGHQWLDEETSHGGRWQQSPATNTSIHTSIIHLEQQPLNESSSSSISSQQQHYLHTLASNKLLHVGKCTQNSNFGGN